MVPVSHQKAILKPADSQRKSPRFTAVFTAAALACLLLALPCHALERIETKLFIFLFRQELAPAADMLAAEADRTAREISSSLGLPLLPPVVVFIAGSGEEFASFQPGGQRVPRWAVGVAYPEKRLIILLRDRRSNIAKTFRHEVNHIVLGHAFKGKNRVPRWLDEGLAMIQAGEWSLSRLSTMTGAVLSGSLLPMDQLAEGFPADLSKARIAYCQSFYFISFLKGRFGGDAFRSFLRDYSTRKNFRRSIQQTYGVSWETMDELWHDYLRLRFSWIPLITSTGTLWFLASLVFVAGYIKKRAASRRKLRLWTEEEEGGYGSDHGGSC